MSEGMISWISCLEGERQTENSPFICLFVLFGPSIVWMVPVYTGEGDWTQSPVHIPSLEVRGWGWKFHPLIMPSSFWDKPPDTSNLISIKNTFLFPETFQEFYFLTFFCFFFFNFFFFFFFFFFLLCCAACGILVPWLGMEPTPSAVEVQSPSRWTTREFSPRVLQSVCQQPGTKTKCLFFIISQHTI